MKRALGIDTHIAAATELLLFFTSVSFERQLCLFGVFPSKGLTRHPHYTVTDHLTQVYVLVSEPGSLSPIAMRLYRFTAYHTVRKSVTVRLVMSPCRRCPRPSPDGDLCPWLCAVTSGPKRHSRPPPRRPPVCWPALAPRSPRRATRPPSNHSRSASAPWSPPSR